MIGTNAGGQGEQCAGKVGKESHLEVGSGKLEFILLQSIRKVSKTVIAQTPSGNEVTGVKISHERGRHRTGSSLQFVNTEQ